jgi:DNA-3-methyladenine glycosylase I
MKNRCPWPGTDPLYLKYHDTEWGVPLHDDRKLLEFLLLDGFQAGLSWITILKNKGIIRNKLKIEAAPQNARSFLAVQKEFESFDDYIWQFTGGKTIKNAWRSLAEIPAWTNESAAMSDDLKKRGFKFVGPTICYAFMQAAGMVNDHLVDCFRYNEV